MGIKGGVWLPAGLVGARGGVGGATPAGNLFAACKIILGLKDRTGLGKARSTELKNVFNFNQLANLLFSKRFVLQPICCLAGLQIR